MSAILGIKGFQEGESGNPNGRPKGSVNETTKRYARFKLLASEKYEEAFDMLWEAMQAKEGWAYNLFFKELVPKNVHQPTIIVQANDTVDGRILAITKELSQISELTHEEALNEVKTLSNAKIAETVVKDQTNIYEKLSAERGRQLHLWLTEKTEQID